MEKSLQQFRKRERERETPSHKHGESGNWSPPSRRRCGLITGEYIIDNLYRSAASLLGSSATQFEGQVFAQFFTECFSLYAQIYWQINCRQRRSAVRATLFCFSNLPLPDAGAASFSLQPTEKKWKVLFFIVTSNFIGR